MAIPAIPAQGAPWLTYAQGVDDEIRTGRLSDPALRAAFGRVFTPEAYGAVGDGTANDTAALQAMFTAAAAAGSKTRVQITRTHKIAGTGSLFTLTTGLHIFGGGTLKVASGNGPFQAIFDASGHDVSGLRIDGITFDGNNTANPITAGQLVAANLQSGNQRNAISFNSGDNITIEHCTFNDFDSEWVISSSGASNVRVLGNQFYRIGNTNPTLFHDHSTIYIDAAGGIEVAGNTFSSVAPGVFTAPINYGACSAIEVHGGNQRVHDNAVIGYNVTGQICASAFGGYRNIDWHDNVAYSCGHGFSIVPYSPGMANVKIHDNTFDLDYLTWRAHPFVSGGFGVSMNFSDNAPIDGMEITHNTIVYREGTYTGLTSTPGAVSTGVTYWRQTASHDARDRNIRISDNLIVGSPDTALYLLFDRAEGIEVERNTVRNANAAANDKTSAYAIAIHCFAYGFMHNADVSGNKVIDNQTASNAPYGNTAATVGKAYRVGSTGTGSGNVTAERNKMSITDGTVTTYFEKVGSVYTDPPLLTVGGYYTPGHSTAGAGAANGAGLATFAPVTLGAGIVTEIGCEVFTAGAAGSVVRLGIYRDNDSRPGELVLDAGTVTATTTGIKTKTISAALDGGRYWLCVVPQGGSPNLRIFDSGMMSGPVAFTGTDAFQNTTGTTGLFAVGMTGALPASAPAPADFTPAYACYVKA